MHDRRGPARRPATTGKGPWGVVGTPGGATGGRRSGPGGRAPYCKPASGCNVLHPAGCDATTAGLQGHGSGTPNTGVQRRRSRVRAAAGCSRRACCSRLQTPQHPPRKPPAVESRSVQASVSPYAHGPCSSPARPPAPDSRGRNAMGEPGEGGERVGEKRSAERASEDRKGGGHEGGRLGGPAPAQWACARRRLEGPTGNDSDA